MRTSIFKRLGAPDSVITTLFLLALVLTLAPWFPDGIDFGVLQVPPMPTGTVLKITGPVLLALVIFMALPIWGPRPGLRFVKAEFADTETCALLTLKLLNTGPETALAHTVEVDVFAIHVLFPDRAMITYLEPSATYDLALPVRDVPYTVSVPVSHEIKKGDADAFTLRVVQDFSELDAIVELFQETLRAHSDVYRRDGETDTVIVPQGAERKAFPDFQAALSEGQAALLDQLGLTDMLPTQYIICDYATHFRLTLVYNENETLDLGEFIYLTRRHGGGPVRLDTAENRVAAARLRALGMLGAVMNLMAREVLEGAKAGDGRVEL